MQGRSLDQEDPWRKAWQPTAVFLPRESHGQRNLEGYSPQSHKELDMTFLAYMHPGLPWGFTDDANGKELACQYRRGKRPEFDP